MRVGGTRNTRSRPLSKGNIKKVKRPEKVGMALASKLWNNKNQPIEVRVGGTGTLRAGALSKATSKPKKTGKASGGVSGKIWNNKTSPLGYMLAARALRMAGKLSRKNKIQKAAWNCWQARQVSGQHTRQVAGAPITQIGLDYTGAYRPAQ